MSNWSPDPKQILITPPSSGAANMGDVADETSPARFGRDLTRPYVLAWLRVHFAGSGSGTADMTIKVDSRLGAHHNCTLKVIKAVGMGNDAFVRIERDEYEKFVFQPGDIVVCEWVNPDSGNITWGVEPGLAYA